MSFDLLNGRCPYCDAVFMARKDYDLHMVQCELQEAELHRQQQLMADPSNVRRLPGAPVPENESVEKTVEMLEEMLAQAKRGEVRSIAMAWTDKNRKVLRQWHNNGEYMVLVGGVSWLLHDMNNGNCEE